MSLMDNIFLHYVQKEKHAVIEIDGELGYIPPTRCTKRDMKDR